MLSESNSRFTRTHKQFFAIALLSAGLIVAIKTQPSDTSITATSPKGTELAISSVAMELSQQERETNFDTSLYAVNELPRRSLSVLEDHQLFRRVTSARRPSISSRVVVPVEVKAVYGDAGHANAELGDHASNRTSALIGNAIVRPGQYLRDGLTVTEVSARGIKVSD